MLRLYGHPLSSGVHMVRNMLTLLDVPHETIDGDGSEISLVDGDVTLSTSCSALVYLGRKYGRGVWLPVDAAGEARVLEWFTLCAREDVGDAFLEALDAHLRGRAFLVGKRPTIADIANYTTVKNAADAGCHIDRYRALTDWLARLEQLARFIPAPSQELRAS